MTEATTRQRIVTALRAEAHTAGELSRAVGVPTSEVYDHVDHVAESLDERDERLLVSPPACHDCGFDDFDDPVNAPSRCPECRNEGVTTPTFTVESG